MNQFKTNTSGKHSKLKVALIPLLLLVLLYVLFQSDEKPADYSSAKTKEVVQTEDEKTNLPVKRTIDLPTISLAEITQHDPFRLLPVLQKKIVKQDVTSEATDNQQKQQQDTEYLQAIEDQRLAEIKAGLETQSVSGVILSPTSRAAIINSKVYHEGDYLEEGLRVVKINADGITVEIETPAQQSPE